MPDPILTDGSIAVPIGLIACLVALTATTWPLLVGESVDLRRRRRAVLGSWCCLAAVAAVAVAGFVPGLHGFIALAAVVGVATTTLLHARSRPA